MSIPISISQRRFHTLLIQRS